MLLSHDAHGFGSVWSSFMLILRRVHDRWPFLDLVRPSVEGVAIRVLGCVVRVVRPIKEYGRSGSTEVIGRGARGCVPDGVGGSLIVVAGSCVATEYVHVPDGGADLEAMI